MHLRTLFLPIFSAIALVSWVQAQTTSVTPVAATVQTAVPALIPYAFSASGIDGKPLTGETSATFLLFKDEIGGQPLWAETQVVSFDSAGQYAVKLGASSPSGFPLEVFANGTARWLEVQVAGQKPQPRVLLATVPYAAKAADAATLGGLPAAAFALAGTNPRLKSENGGTQTSDASGVSPDAASTVTTPGGTANTVPIFTGANTIANSVIVQSGKSIGIGKTPNTSAILDVNGGLIMRGNMIVSRTGNATASRGYPSNGFDFYANAYNSSTKVADNPHFQLQSEPVGNNSSSTSATFNLLYANGGTAAETGFSINPNGTLNFAPAQVFPGAVTSVALSPPSSDFNITSGPVTGSGTLSFAWVVAPTSANSGNSIVKRDSNGGFTTGAINAASVGVTNALTVFGTSFMGPANLSGPVGIGTDSPAALLNLNKNNQSNADSLLIGNNKNKGLQLRDTGTGVDIESIGVALNANFVTEEPIYLNPNAGAVFVHDATEAGSGDGTVLPALTVGGNPNSSLDPDLVNNAYSAHFKGDILIDGDTFTPNIRVAVDYPLDPANKYLTHTTINSSEALNLYSGNVITDELGLATIHLPDWFEAENTDFRYQLTVIGRFAQAIVSKEIEHNQFTLNTNAPGVKVSWQVTAKRNDPYTRAHPLVVERQKQAGERGTYMHPEVYGQPEEKRTGEGRVAPRVKPEGAAVAAVRQ